jgi:hypothetical protein
VRRISVRVQIVRHKQGHIDFFAEWATRHIFTALNGKSKPPAFSFLA